MAQWLVRVEPAGIEPATSGLQSLAQGGPFTEKISMYAGFVRISEARDSANTDQIRISTYPVTYPPPVRSMKPVTASEARELDAYRDCSNRLLGNFLPAAHVHRDFESCARQEAQPPKASDPPSRPTIDELAATVATGLLR